MKNGTLKFNHKDLIVLILDTHIWIWLVNGDEKIEKSGLLPDLEKAARENSIRIPAICLWEVAMLAAKNRIHLSSNPLDWINNALSAPGLRLYPLTPAIAYESANLPGDFHGDPADRMIVASARVLNGELMTFDGRILKYAGDGYVNVIQPKRTGKKRSF
jgi:PIN domain nuclease of toxin-antitoxin system